MPIYEYECLLCHNIHEVIQKFNEEPLKNCPICGGAVKKLISQSSFILKGSGWYVTDYARKNKSESDSSKSDKTSKEDKST
ncbi:MAG: zinc ribbon domain-containing protein [Thermodesulfovibrio sp.]|nr:zinc ribbon domain-containing protein [Thermodesulfovibrio sp.]MCX7724171.1 zinc ribbon domain-containing protein [Thermodesulfovibrio sp.]MDW7971845.1 FmdB family zinc ribbon protein [Thermodesulfovibrio sp.]